MADDTDDLDNHSEESDYDLDLQHYQPIEWVASEHGVLLVSAKMARVQLSDLQLLHHGVTAVRCNSQGHSTLCHVRLESDNGTLSWSRPHWSALRAHSSSLPDYAFVNERRARITPGLSSRYQSGQSIIDDLDDGHLDLELVKEVRQTEPTAVDVATVSKRHGLPAEACGVALLYGVSLAEHHSIELVLPPAVALVWLRALRRLVCGMLVQKRRHSDRRMHWLKQQYLQLYFDAEKCHGPTPVESIKVNLC